MTKLFNLNDFSDICVYDKNKSPQEIYDDLKTKKGAEVIIYHGTEEVDVRKSLQYYDIDSGLWSFEVIGKGLYEVVVKTLIGKTVNISVRPEYTVKTFKRLVSNKLGIPMDQLRMIHTGHQLEDRYQLNTYSIKEGSCIHIVLHLRGGGTPFVNPAGGTKTIEWSERAPPWRMVACGISVSGNCATVGCPAYKKNVICNLGVRAIEIKEDSSLFKCPMCGQHIDAYNVGYSKCYWKWVGFRNDEKYTSGDINHAGDNYVTYDLNECGLLEWDFLKFYTYNYAKDQNYTCSLCLKDMFTDTVTNECGHKYHLECSEKWMETNKDCQMCMLKSNT